jgi:hypothetical protein
LQSGHRLPPLTVEQNKALATPVEEMFRHRDRENEAFWRSPAA